MAKLGEKPRRFLDESPNVGVVTTLRPDGFQFWVFQQNERARRFYEAHGAVAVEFTDGEGNEEKTPDVRYRWTSSS